MPYPPSDIELIKSFWIALRAEQLRTNLDDNQGNGELLEEAASMEWYANYESVGHLNYDNDPIMQTAITRFEKIYGKRQSLDSTANIQPSNTTGTKTAREIASSIKEASPDHPIFKRGFVIGGRRSRPSSRNTAETPSPSGNRKQRTSKD